MPGQIGFDHDWKPQSDGSYSPEQMHRLLYDLNDEPNWRPNASLEMQFYDGNQLDQPTLALMAERGIPPQITNMIQPAIDNALGYEEIMRTDIVIKGEDEKSFETATAVNAKYKEAERLADFDDAVAHAFADMMRIGIGWIGVTRNDDPFKYPYRVKHVPWREMWWDWRARDFNLQDARYVIRRQWYDADDLAAHLPQHAQLIKYASTGWPAGWIDVWDRHGSSIEGSLDLGRDNNDLVGSRHTEENSTLEEREWRDPQRGRLALYEILYKVPRRTRAIRMPSGKVVEYRKNNPIHEMALQKGFPLIEGPSMRYRQAYYLGPHKIGDRELEINDWHYIPFICRREDGDGSVYGYIRNMKSPQEAINARHSRTLYDMSARKVLIDEDAVDDHQQTAEEIARSDAYITLKSDRTHPEGLRLVPNTDMTALTFELLQMSKQDIADTTGWKMDVPFQEFVARMGQTLARPMANYKSSKMSAAKLLTAMVVDDLKTEDNTPVNITAGDRVVRTIMLNSRRESDGVRDNDVVLLKTKLSWAEAPKSQSYSDQTFKALSEIVKSMPPDIQPALLDMVVRAAQIKNGDEIIERIRGITGFGPEPEDPAEREEIARKKAEQEAIEKRLQEIEMMEREAQAKKVAAEASFTEAKAQKLMSVDTDLTAAKVETEEAKVDKIDSEIDRGDSDVIRKAEDSVRSDTKSTRDDVEQRRKMVETGARIIEDAKIPGIAR